MTPDQIIAALNDAGFVVTLYQGSYSTTGLVMPSSPKYLWHGNIYSSDRHKEWASLRHQMTYEEIVKLPCFHFQLVAHHEESYQSCLEKLWQEYLSPTIPPRVTRTSVNPAFLRHKRKASQPITDDDLLA